MSRAVLRWTIGELSRMSGVGTSTFKRLENASEIVSANVGTLSRLKVCFEAAGIEFIGSPDDAPGIRIHLPKA